MTVDQYPMLVRFRDLNDPKSVENVYEMEKVDPRAPENKFRVKADHFEEAFGKGVKLKEIKVEMIEDSVTERILEYLPWLPDVKHYFSGDQFKSGNSAPEVLHRGHFYCCSYKKN